MHIQYIYYNFKWLCNNSINKEKASRCEFLRHLLAIQEVKFLLMSFPAHKNRQELYIDGVQMRSTPVTSWSARSSLMSNSYSPFTFSIKGETTE